MEPVDIEFVLKTVNLREETQKMKSEIAGVSGSVVGVEEVFTRMTGNLKRQMELQRQLIREISGDIRKMQNDLSNASSPQQKKDITSEITAAKKTLFEENARLIGMQRQQLSMNEKEVVSQGGLISSLGKWALGFATVATAMKIAKSIIESTEATSDKFERTINAATTATNYFFKAISSGDWSNFWDGMDRAIAGSIKLTDEMQKIERREIEQEVKGAEAQKKIAELRAGTFDKGVENNAKLIENTTKIIEIQKADYENQAAIAKDKYELTRNQLALENKMSADKIEALTFEYSKNEELLALGEKFNEVQKKIGTGGTTEYLKKTRPEKYAELQTEIALINSQLQNSFQTTGEEAAKLSKQFEVPTIKALKGLTDLKKSQIDLEKLSQTGRVFDERALAAAINKRDAKEAEAEKKAKEAAKLENTIKATKEEMEAVTGKELDDLAVKLTLLEKELKLRQNIINAAILKARDPETEAFVQANQMMQGKGVSPVIQKGSTKTVQGILYEVTAIDKTGPVWTKVKGELNRLKKFESDKNKEGAKEQEELYEEIYKKRQRFEEDLLTYSRQFTGELIDQLGLTQEQGKELQGLADALFNVASGNYLAAGFSVASTILTALFSGSGEEDSTTMALKNINNLLEKQSAILTNLSGSNYFDLAAKQYDDYGKAVDLNNKKLQDTTLFTKKEWSDLQTYFKQWQQDFPNPQLTFTTWVKNQFSETNKWTPAQFIDAYTKGTIALDGEQIEWVKSIVELQKQRAELLQETFRTALGFDSSDVSSSILQGIQDGLKLSESGLGGFAQSFGEKVKSALEKNITEALDVKLTEGFLTDFNNFMSDNNLTDDERRKLENDYQLAVSEANARYEAIRPILEKYGVSASSASSSMKGVSASATEDAVSAMVGQLTAVRVDIKEILKTMAFGQDDVAKNLFYMKEIAQNTSYNKELVVIRDELKEMNATIKRNG